MAINSSSLSHSLAERPFNHAPYLHHSKNLDFCCWFAGSLEGHADVALYGSLNDRRGSRNSNHWCMPFQIFDVAGSAIGNSVVLEGPSCSPHLLSMVFPPRGARSSQILLSKISDCWRGTSVTRPLEVGPGIWIRHSAFPIGETLILPVCDIRERPPKSGLIVLDSSLSVEMIRLWDCTEFLIQPQIIQINSGETLVFFRDMKTRGLWFSELSQDLDISEPNLTDIPNNNSGFVVVSNDYRNYIICNTTNNRFDRSELSVFDLKKIKNIYEKDYIFSLEKRSRVPAYASQNSYPHGFMDSDGNISVSYNKNSSDIVNCLISDDFLNYKKNQKIILPTDRESDPCYHIRKLKEGEQLYMGEKRETVKHLGKRLCNKYFILPDKTRIENKSFGYGIITLKANSEIHIFKENIDNNKNDSSVITNIKKYDKKEIIFLNAGEHKIGDFINRDNAFAVICKIY